MSSDADLTNASRKILLTVIAEQQATISEQQATNSEQRATIGELQRRIGDPETSPARRPAFGHARQQADVQPPSAG